VRAKQIGWNMDACPWATPPEPLARPHTHPHPPPPAPPTKAIMFVENNARMTKRVERLAARRAALSARLNALGGGSAPHPGGGGGGEKAAASAASAPASAAPGAPSPGDPQPPAPNGAGGGGGGASALGSRFLSGFWAREGVADDGGVDTLDGGGNDTTGPGFNCEGFSVEEVVDELRINSACEASVLVSHMAVRGWGRAGEFGGWGFVGWGGWGLGGLGAAHGPALSPTSCLGADQPTANQPTNQPQLNHCICSPVQFAKMFVVISPYIPKLKVGGRGLLSEQLSP
jgi:hypothetical protein